MPQELQGHEPAPALPPHSEKDALLEWTALEFEPRSKERRSWVRRTIIAASVIAAIMLLLRNILGAVVALLGGFVFLLEAFRPPRQVNCALSDKGVRLGRSFHAYKNLISFWVFRDIKEVSIKTKKTFGHNIVLPLGATDPDKVREILLQFLPEEEQKNSASDEWLRSIGF